MPRWKRRPKKSERREFQSPVLILILASALSNQSEEKLFTCCSSQRACVGPISDTITVVPGLRYYPSSKDILESRSYVPRIKDKQKGQKGPCN